jgi:hypothetical protein
LLTDLALALLDVLEYLHGRPPPSSAVSSTVRVRQRAVLLVRLRNLAQVTLGPLAVGSLKASRPPRAPVGKSRLRQHDDEIADSSVVV